MGKKRNAPKTIPVKEPVNSNSDESSSDEEDIVKIESKRKSSKTDDNGNVWLLLFVFVVSNPYSFFFITRKLSERGVVYLGRIPYGFFEDPMRQFFSQFGEITRLRLSRNKKVRMALHDDDIYNILIALVYNNS